MCLNSQSDRKLLTTRRNVEKVKNEDKMNNRKSKRERGGRWRTDRHTKQNTTLKENNIVTTDAHKPSTTILRQAQTRVQKRMRAYKQRTRVFSRSIIGGHCSRSHFLYHKNPEFNLPLKPTIK